LNKNTTISVLFKPYLLITKLTFV